MALGGSTPKDRKGRLARSRMGLAAMAFVSVSALLGACGSSSDGQPAAATTTSTTSTVTVTGTITVYAAQSLTGAFTEIGAAFEGRHRGTSVKFNFNGSSTLVSQIMQAAPADVFASADQPNMDRVVTAGLVAGAPQIFVKNLLQIVVARGNPKGITGLADLAEPGTTVDLCAPTVPCGSYARQALTRASVTVEPVSAEQNVTAVVTRVANGEADAGIVYQSDVLAANAKVSGVVIPASQNVVAEYPAATLKSSANPSAAEAFRQFVQSGDGQAILAKYGFAPL